MYTSARRGQSKRFHSGQKRSVFILPRYNATVTAFLQAGMHLLVFLFFLGLAGSAVIVVISFIEDLNELLGD